MESPDFFTPLPLSMDAQSKAISSTSSSAPSDLLLELSKLNSTHRSLLQLEPPGALTPLPPQQVNPKRSQQIMKMRETAQASLAKKTGKDSSTTADGAPSSEPVKLFGLAIDMAAQRHEWEAAGLRREELSQLYRGRAEAYIAIRAWADGYVDALMSLECKAKGNPVRSGAVVTLGARD